MRFPSLDPFLKPSILTVGIIGAPPGILFTLSLSTIQVWLTQTGISKAIIGLFALAALPNALKFLWAPIIDQVKIPYLTNNLGRRRSWACFLQALLVLALLGLGSSDPSHDLESMIIFVGLVSLFGASQEIVLDAYRIESLKPTEYGHGITANVLGYRLGTIIGGAGSLYIAAYAGWFWVYAAMAFFIALTTCIILIRPEPTPHETDLMKERQQKALSFLNTHKNWPPFFVNLAAWIYGAVIGPFSEFMRRPDWFLIVCLILVYRFGDNLINNMANVFYLDIGFTMIDIANVTKVFGVFATIIGGIIGGIISARLGFLKGLLLCGALHTLSNTMLILQAYLGPNIPLLYTSIALENTTGGMTTAAFVVYLSSLCHKSFTGTQYALLSALWYLSTNLGAIGGTIAEKTTWISYFIITIFAALPGLFFLFILWKREEKRIILYKKIHP